MLGDASILLPPGRPSCVVYLCRTLKAACHAWRLVQTTVQTRHPPVNDILLRSCKMTSLLLSATALLASSAHAALVPVHHSSQATAAAPPLLLWHGLGDTFDGDGIKSIGDLYRNVYPGSAVYAVHLGDDGSADRQSTFFGDINEQIEAVCQDIQATKEITSASSVNAMGLSQGGVFIRGLVERCNRPPVRNLVTFGSPHGGISTFAKCKDGDWWCSAWSGTLKSNTWGEWVQTHLIPAQYFRDPADMDGYLEHSNYLADINNERAHKEKGYVKNLAGLDRFVMIRFAEENVISPNISTWFGDMVPDEDKPILLRDRDLYKKDWLGLSDIDKRGGLLFKETPGKHMRIGDGVMEQVMRDYFAPVDVAVPVYGGEQSVIHGED